MIDLRNLDSLIKDWFAYSKKVGSASRADRLAAAVGDPLDDWFFERLFGGDDLQADDAVWPVVVALVEMAPDDAAIGAVAAGPLQDLATHHGAQFGDRLVAKTGTDPKFRKAMRGLISLDGVPEPERSRLLAMLEDEYRPQPANLRQRPNGRDRGWPACRFEGE